MKTVLYCDDEPAALRLFSKTFGGEFNVVTAESASEGMRLLDHITPDVVLADAVMPIETGDSFLHRARAKCPNALIAIVTAYTQLIPSMAAAGITHVILKPYESEDMRRFILQRSPVPPQSEIKHAAAEAASVVRAAAAVALQTQASVAQGVADVLQHSADDARTAAGLGDKTVETMTEKEAVIHAANAVIETLKKINEERQ